MQRKLIRNFCRLAIGISSLIKKKTFSKIQADKLNLFLHFFKIVKFLARSFGETDLRCDTVCGPWTGRKRRERVFLATEEQ